MALNNIDIVDKDYEQCTRLAMPRQIRFKRSSYDSIFSKFRNKLHELYERKMNKTIDKVLSTTYNDDNLEDKLLMNSERIIALDSKIRKLSKDDVPSKYVKSRAIKLRDYMMDNTLKNSAGLYLVNLTKSDIINMNEDLNSIHESDLQNLGPDNSDYEDYYFGTDDGDKSDLSSNNINKEEIGNLINREFDSIENSDDELMTKFVSPEEVRDVVESNPSISQTLGLDNKSNTVSKIDSTFEETDDPVTDVIIDTEKVENRDSLDGNSEASDEPIFDIISNSSNDIDDSSENEDINSDDIRVEIDNALRNVKVSSSESSVARINKFDDQGSIRFKDNYTPMSDDEIAESQKKINSDLEDEDKSFENVFGSKLSLNNLFIPVDLSSVKLNNGNLTNDRDVPLVVDSRDDKSQQNGDVVEYRFDDSDVSENTDEMGKIKDNNDSSVISRTDEFRRLKAKALELQQKKMEIDKNMADVQRSAVEKSKKAQAAKENADASTDELNNKMEEFKSYCKELERDNEKKANDTKIFQDDIEMNTNFIEIQNSKASRNIEMISELDRIMSGSKNSRSK